MAMIMAKNQSVFALDALKIAGFQYRKGIQQLCDIFSGHGDLPVADVVDEHVFKIVGILDGNVFLFISLYIDVYLVLLVVLVAQRTVVVAAGNRCDDAVVKQKGRSGKFPSADSSSFFPMNILATEADVSSRSLRLEKLFVVLDRSSPIMMGPAMKYPMMDSSMISDMAMCANPRFTEEDIGFSKPGGELAGRGQVLSAGAVFRLVDGRRCCRFYRLF